MITVRVDKEMKRRMEKMKETNWSEVIRAAILQKIEAEGEKNMAMAVLLNERNVITPDEGFDSAKAIREWRQKAHGR